MKERECREIEHENDVGMRMTRIRMNKKGIKMNIRRQSKVSVRREITQTIRNRNIRIQDISVEIQQTMFSSFFNISAYFVAPSYHPCYRDMPVALAHV